MRGPTLIHSRSTMPTVSFLTLALLGAGAPWRTYEVY